MDPTPQAWPEHAIITPPNKEIFVGLLKSINPYNQHYRHSMNKLIKEVTKVYSERAILKSSNHLLFRANLAKQSRIAKKKSKGAQATYGAGFGRVLTIEMAKAGRQEEEYLEARKQHGSIVKTLRQTNAKARKVRAACNKSKRIYKEFIKLLEEFWLTRGVPKTPKRREKAGFNMLGNQSIYLEEETRLYDILEAGELKTHGLGLMEVKEEVEEEVEEDDDSLIDPQLRGIAGASQESAINV